MTIQDLQHYRQLIENSANPTLTEDYESRISNVADKIYKRVPGTKITKDDLDRWIRWEIDWPLGSVTQEQVIKDVLAKLKGKIEIRKTLSGSSAKSQSKKALQYLARWISDRFTDELGNIFPDGDPHDAFETIMDKVLSIDYDGTPQDRERVFGSPDLDLDIIRKNTDPRSWLTDEDWIKVVVQPMAFQQFKKTNKVDVYGYLANLWDQYKADAEYDAKNSPNPEQYLRDRGLDGSNPYR